MKAQSIDRDAALAIFDDGKPHSPREIAVALNVHQRTVAWFLSAAEARGWLRRVPPRPLRRNPDFGQFVRAS